MELYLHSLKMPSWHGAQTKHRDTFTFTHNPEDFNLNLHCCENL
jgi:hypothetical protein